MFDQNKAEIWDDFLSDFGSFRLHCDRIAYDGITNPADDIFYPGVSLEIPTEIKKEIREKLNAIAGVELSYEYMFLRLSLDGCFAPHQVHNDHTMGDYLFMLYLNRSMHCEGGTSIVEHKTEVLSRHPLPSNGQGIWERDHADYDAWEIVKMIEMKANRACIFPASLMHRAEPVGGFGSDARDGRLVLTSFII